MDKNKIMAAMLAATLLEHKANKEKTEIKDLRVQAKEIGLKLKEAQLGYMDAGFTEEQAFELTINALN